MRFPKMRTGKQTREFIQEFGGLDRRVRGAENAFVEMKNLSSDFYPALSPRSPRALLDDSFGDVTALTFLDHFAYIKNNSLVWDADEAVTVPLKDTVQEKRKLVKMGAYLVVFPDCMYLNTQNLEDRGAFRMTLGEGDLTGATFTLYYDNKDLSGKAAKSVFTGVEITNAATAERLRVFWAPQAYAFSGSKCLSGVPNTSYACFADYKVVGEGVSLLQKSGEPYVYVADTTASGTVTVTNTVTGCSVTHTVSCDSVHSDYEKIPSLTVGYWLTDRGFYYTDESGAQTKLTTRLRMDAPCFSAMPDGNITSFSLTVSDPDYYSSSVNGATVECKDGAVWIDNAYICETPRFKLREGTTCICSFDAVAPNMDFVIEAKNRLWGCRYGQDKNGRTVNEIYASAQGDFREWYPYKQISTDPWIASVGHMGAFTGAVNYRGTPLFFKENVMYKIYGDYPENFQIVSDESTGVQAGCDKSPCVLSGVLYYKSPIGFFAYDGSSSVRIDAVLGNERFENAVCEGIGTKLYVSMQGEQAAHSGLYAYDTERDMWHMEDNTEARFFTVDPQRGLCFVNEAGKLMRVQGGGLEAAEESIDFFAETGVIGYSTPDSKYVSRLALRVSVPHDAQLHLYLEYDSSGVWEYKGSIEGNGLQTFTVPVVPQMCDHFRIRLAGKGECRIYGFSKVLEEGGAV